MKGFSGGFGGGNMNNLFKQAQKLQKNMEETKKQLEEMEFESTSGGGVVSDDIEMLQDLIISCINDVYKKVDDETNREMSKLTGGFNIPGF